ncbi:protein asteroid [Eupeodes corollae]|uniref:protein asteroid n=1 Tax=Eupeodes corollae TaxID=290404 RepID=UPI002492DB85|nr:protein asteroid [Eupeodes corollae]
MGVRGLTSFIARNAELYLKPFELHDCNLVIDGDNLACNLYKDAAGRNSAFGGDYDAFYRTVIEFFHVLSECNIRPYVLMDGGYEKKKLRTVWQRLRGKISVIKKIDPVNSQNIFPLMMREVFIDALNDCAVPVMRCVFEADDELAALSRKLNCPVLSYDSDFYIHNVKYIPLVTLTVKAHKKKVSQKGVRDENSTLTKSSVKHMEKRAKSQKIIKGIEVDAEDRNAPKTGKTYKYLDCCMYKIENLIERGSLSREKLPLFAALLGNDYIHRAAFKTFFAQMKQKGMGKRTTKIQKRIRKILQWLKHETLDSALEKIVGTLKKPQRNKLIALMKGAVEGYTTESCASFEFFKNHYEDAFEESSQSENDESEGSDEDVEESDEEVEEDAEEEEVDGEEELEEEESEETLDDQKLAKETDDEAPKDEDLEVIVSESSGEENSGDGEDDSDDDESDPNTFLPQWFRDRLYPAHLPRFLVDLSHLQIYINNPQIEHFPFNDCNEIGIPILKHIFYLLHSVDGDEEDKIFKTKRVKRHYQAARDHGDDTVPYLRYLTRVTRVTNIHTVRYPLEQSTNVAFNPVTPDPELFRVVFRKLKLDSDKLFKEIEKLPSDLRMYFLSIVFWIQKTPHADLLHLHSLLICLVLLRTVDAKVEPIRDCKAFQKRFGNIIKKEQLIRAKEQETGTVKELRPEVKALPVIERMKFISMQDCLLVQDNLLKHFHMQEIFKKKYDDFSSTVLHGFAEFQSVVFNLHALNGLLGNFYESPKMAQTYCGVFLYNIYELLRSRIDLKYFIEHHIFRYSPMMFDLYEFFADWLNQFIPEWQGNKIAASTLALSKNVLKKRKAAAKKKAAAEAAAVAAAATEETGDSNSEVWQSASTEEGEEEDEFYDVNNQFCTLLEIK